MIGTNYAIFNTRDISKYDGVELSIHKIKYHVGVL